MQRQHHQSGRTSLTGSDRSRATADEAASQAATLPGSGRRYDYYWSQRALRRSGVGLGVLTLALLPAVFANGLGARALALLALLVVARAAHGLAVRARTHGPVLSIDMLGITDRRLASRCMHWQEIAAFARVDTARARSLEFFVTWPETHVAGGRRGLRWGAWMQRRMGLPAGTISLLLIDAEAGEIVRAIAEFRPGLLPNGMRRPPG